MAKQTAALKQTRTKAAPAPAASPVRPENQQDEEWQDNKLRPKGLADFIGQETLKANLAVYISAAKERGEALEHVLFKGPPGLGKTTLARIVANELGVKYIETSAPALDKPKDLMGLLGSLEKRSVFFIDEIHRLKPIIEERLYKAMEDFEFDWMIGEGPGARPVSIPLKPFTLIGATTREDLVAKPLRDRFGIPEKLDYYKPSEMEAIIRRSAGLLDIVIDDDAAALLSLSARGTPRVANRLLRRIRDFAQVEKSPRVTRAIVERGLERLEIDGIGLEKQDRNILRVLIQTYQGRPVGAETLATSVGEPAAILQSYYEPYLIQQGLIQITPRGRIATAKAYKHLGIENRQEPMLFEPMP
jgi:Holliday junction DNA helicase RuvB